MTLKTKSAPRGWARDADETVSRKSSRTSDYHSPTAQSSLRTGYPPRITNVNAGTKREAARHARHHPWRVRPGQSDLAAAKSWLFGLLEFGPIYGADAEQIGHAAGVPWDLLEAAKARLGVKFVDLNGRSPRRCWGLWQWVLPGYLTPRPDNDNADQDADEADEDDDEKPLRRRRIRTRPEDRGESRPERNDDEDLDDWEVD